MDDLDNKSKSTAETLLDSRLNSEKDFRITETRSTSKRDNYNKWFIAFLLGLIFAIISSPPAYKIVNSTIMYMGGSRTYYGGPNIPGLLIQTGIFIIVVRILLW